MNYASNPVPADTLIAKLVSEYNDGWGYTASAAAFAAKAQVKDGIIANGPDCDLGDFSLARVNSLIKSLSPIYAKEGKTPKAGLTAPEIVTNRFIDRASICRLKVMRQEHYLVKGGLENHDLWLLPARPFRGPL